MVVKSNGDRPPPKRRRLKSVPVPAQPETQPSEPPHPPRLVCLPAPAEQVGGFRYVGAAPHDAARSDRNSASATMLRVAARARLAGLGGLGKPDVAASRSLCSL